MQYLFPASEQFFILSDTIHCPPSFALSLVQQSFEEDNRYNSLCMITMQMCYYDNNTFYMFISAIV